jgi:hypothetical protein
VNGHRRVSINGVPCRTLSAPDSGRRRCTAARRLDSPNAPSAAPNSSIELGSGTVRTQPAVHWRVRNTPSASIEGAIENAKRTEVKATRLGAVSGSDVLEKAMPLKSSRVSSIANALSVLELPMTRYSSRVGKVVVDGDVELVGHIWTSDRRVESVTGTAQAMSEDSKVLRNTSPP